MAKEKLEQKEDIKKVELININEGEHYIVFPASKTQTINKPKNGDVLELPIADANGLISKGFAKEAK